MEPSGRMLKPAADRHWATLKNKIGMRPVKAFRNGRLAAATPCRYRHRMRCREHFIVLPDTAGQWLCHAVRRLMQEMGSATICFIRAVAEFVAGPRRHRDAASRIFRYGFPWQAVPHRSSDYQHFARALFLPSLTVDQQKGKLEDSYFDDFQSGHVWRITTKITHQGRCIRNGNCRLKQAEF